MLEAEVSFVEKMDNVMDLVEDMLRHMTKGLHQSRVGQELLHSKRSGETDEECSKRSEELERRWQGMMNGPWPRITYTEAIKLLRSSTETFEYPPTWGLGLQAEHERYIASQVGKGSPVFVTCYPKKIKPFYMLPSTYNPSTVECFDLLVPEVCEIVGGSMREYRLKPLVASMRELGMVSSPEGTTAEEADFGSLKWYVDLRRWGSVPHGGFGLGFDRLLGYLAGVPNIREIVTFPRWVGRCDC